MNMVSQVARAGTLTILLVCASGSSAQRALQGPRGTGDTGSPEGQAGEPRYIKAFVIDDRLSALRRKPSVQSEVIRRLRLAHRVFIVSSPSGRPMFCRVAVTRRTRGWIHSSALAIQNRAGDDQRIMTLIENSGDGFDRITLCRIIIDSFGRSRLVPRALFLLGQEAERAAQTLSQRTRRRLAEVRGADASVRDYYLSDAGLDRYSRLGIVFDFNEATGEFVYDGKAYREIVRRFPQGEEAKLARQRLDLTSRNARQDR